MRALSASEYLSVWERGVERLPYERALALLEEACPEMTPEELASLSIGRRDGLLLTMRESAFGPSLTALSTCPFCMATAEIEVDIAHLRQSQEGRLAESVETCASIVLGEREYRVRAANTEDVAACTGLDAEGAARRIVARCLSPVAQESGAEEVRLSEESLERVEEAMGALDPQADLRMEMVCSACRQPWTERFDIVGFLWNELDAWARRTLREIHALAAAYGWTELEVLSLSAVRRQCYLEMVSV